MFSTKHRCHTTVFFVFLVTYFFVFNIYNSVIFVSATNIVSEDNDSNSVYQNNAVRQNIEQEFILNGDGTHSYKNLKRKSLLISTIDGKLSSIHIDKSHKKSILEWQIDLGNGPLLSQSIGQLELSESAGVPYRIVPSLDGNLYRLEANGLQPLSLSTDILLASSFKISDDSFIVGGKEQLISGVDIISGSVLYTCASSGCKDVRKETSNADKGVLLVRRTNNIVRAINKSGKEEWNYKVGETDLTFHSCQSNKKNSDEDFSEQKEASKHCTKKPTVEYPGTVYLNKDYQDAEYNIKFDVPSGLIYCTDSSGNFMWKVDLQVPITRAWEFDYLSETLAPISIFDMRQALPFSGNNRMHIDYRIKGMPVSKPHIYVGQYDNQIYIQSQPNQYLGMYSGNQNTRKVPKLLFESAARFRSTSPDEGAIAVRHNHDLRFVDNIVLNGFYLANVRPSLEYSDTHHVDGKDDADLSEWVDYDNESIIYQVIHVYPGSLWYYWPQILLITVFTSISSVFLYLFITHYFFHKIVTLPPVVERIPSTETSSTLQNSQNFLKQDTNIFEIKFSPNGTFTSRYEEEFKHVRCLGKGGFGLVFEATHKIDDCSYAIKRVSVKNSDHARERILREVKALAKLDHSAIVRYYQAWFECPPPGWQEQKDRELFHCDVSDEEFPSGTMASICASVSAVSEIKSRIGKRRRLFSDSVTSGERQRRRRHTTTSSGSDRTHDFNPLRPFGDVDLTSFSNTDWKSFNEEESGSFSQHRSLIKEDSFSFVKPNDEDSLDDLIVFADSEGDGANNNDHDSAVNFELESDSISSHKGRQQFAKAARRKQKKTGSLDIPDAKYNSKEELQSVEVSDRKLPQAKLYLYIQMQLCQKQSLRDWLRNNIHNRSRPQLVDIFLQITSAVAFVHQCNLIHRDLKCSNIFFAMDGSIKIGDFGLATALIEDETEVASPAAQSARDSLSWHTTQIGTRLYMSPEQSANLAYNEKVDIFSLGLIFFELFFSFNTEMEKVTCMLQAKEQRFPDRFLTEWPEEAAFASRLLSPRPENRPSSAAILVDPLFSEHILNTAQSSPELLVTQRYRSFSLSHKDKASASATSL